MNRRIALVTHELTGGVGTMTYFLYKAIREMSSYDVDLIMLPTSSRDKASVRIIAPSTWFCPPQIVAAEWKGIPYSCVGSVLAEIEFQRYRPRNVLTQLLCRYDLIQIVAGSPAFGAVARSVPVPKCLFAATLLREEQRTLLRETGGWLKTWRTAMAWVGARWENKALQLMDCVFAESEYTRRLFIKSVSPDKLLLGVPGVDTKFFSPNIADKDGNDYILSVGRFSDRRKNVRLLFEAYHKLSTMLPAVPKLVLAGSTPPLEIDWDYAVSLGIKSRVECLVDVSQEKLRCLYSNASLFVLSSDEEGLGFVILEAMASGLPVISTDCGGPSTAVIPGETGILTPIGDARAMAEAMYKLTINPSLRRKMGAAARSRVERLFSLEAAGKTYINEYDRLLATSRQT